MSRPLDLSSVVAKINRASEHLSTLSNEIGDFVQNDLHEIRTESYRRAREWRKYSRREIEELGLRDAFPFRQIDDDTLELGNGVDYQRAFVTVKQHVPVLRFAVLIGDVVNNLRSALDNLVWALSDAEKGPPPYPVPWLSKTQPWKGTNLPVLMDPKVWATARGKNLWALRPSQQTTIKKLQPFK
jgi:hypothetical protein